MNSVFAKEIFDEKFNNHLSDIGFVDLFKNCTVKLLHRLAISFEQFERPNSVLERLGRR